MVFKPGDRVIYVGGSKKYPTTTKWIGRVGTVHLVDTKLQEAQVVLDDDTEPWLWLDNLRHIKDYYIKKFKEAYGKQTNPS